MDREQLKNRVIQYVFYWENTTEGATIENAYDWLNNMGDCENLPLRFTIYGDTFSSRENATLWIFAYNSTLKTDFLLGYITNFSASGIANEIRVSFEKLKNIEKSLTDLSTKE